jgi:hypothetical protein
VRWPCWVVAATPLAIGRAVAARLEDPGVARNRLGGRSTASAFGSAPHRLDRHRSRRMAPWPSTRRLVRARKTARAKAHQSASPRSIGTPASVPGTRGLHEVFAPATRQPPLLRSRQYVPLFRPELPCEEDQSDAASGIAVLLLEASLHDSFELLQQAGVRRRWRHSQLDVSKRATPPLVALAALVAQPIPLEVAISCRSSGRASSVTD